MEVTVLTENTVYKRGFLGEHGLSMLLETGGNRYLFDTGQTDVFLRNADKMKLDLKHLDGIILSHGHYDHCGGMEYWARKQTAAQGSTPGIPIYINRRAFDKKYSEHPKTGEMLFSGIHGEAEAWMKNSGNMKYTKQGCTAIAKNVYLLSQVPFVTGFESVPARFWKEVQMEGDAVIETGSPITSGSGTVEQIGSGTTVGNHPGNNSGTGDCATVCYPGSSAGTRDCATVSHPGSSAGTEDCITVCHPGSSAGTGGCATGDLEVGNSMDSCPKADLPNLTADHMEDEQLLAIREEQGLCVFAGCAHPGIVNCLNYVQSSFPGEHIHAIVAGMHLKGCSRSQLQKTIQALREFGIDSIVPLHCTGLLAIAAIKEALGERCLLAEVGKKIVL